MPCSALSILLRPLRVAISTVYGRAVQPLTKIIIPGEF